MKTKHTIIIIAALIFLVSGFSAPALAQGKGGGRGGPDAIEEFAPGMGHGRGGKMGMHGMGMHKKLQRKIFKSLYPVRLVRRHADEIELTDAQMQKIRKIVTDVRAEVDQLQWDLEDATRQLVKLIESEASKEQVYKQMDAIFKYENKIKKKHMGLMIVVRDILTVEQRQALDKIKQENRKKRTGKKKARRGKRLSQRHRPWNQSRPSV